MNNTEKILLKEIIDYYKKNRLMPSIRYLMKKISANSTNTIYYHLNKLEEYGYLKRNNMNKRIINDDYRYFANDLKYIKVLNENILVKMVLNNKKEYLAFTIKNNYFKDNNIIKGDILIIEKNKQLKNNDLGLFVINNNYYIKKYFYKDGFYILEDDKREYFNNINIIGKVIYVERKIK
jgi:repressor LexA